MSARQLSRRSIAAAAGLLFLLPVTGCGLPGQDDGDASSSSSSSAASSADSTSASASPSSDATPLDSEFSANGTFQSHYELDGLDFVFTVFPTRATPQTSQWFPGGSKYFSFTFTAYDLSRELRDPFDTKREVYLTNISVTTSTVRSDDGEAESPYSLIRDAASVTFDPEPTVLDPYGMLVTSPKGGFELRNQEITATDPATIGINMVLTATVSIETGAGEDNFVQQTIVQEMPISIYPSDTDTVATEIPVDAS